MTSRDVRATTAGVLLIAATVTDLVAAACFGSLLVLAVWLLVKGFSAPASPPATWPEPLVRQNL